jgi:hypothetical protein
VGSVEKRCPLTHVQVRSVPILVGPVQFDHLASLPMKLGYGPSEPRKGNSYSSYTYMKSLASMDTHVSNQPFGCDWDWDWDGR